MNDRSRRWADALTPARFVAQRVLLRTVLRRVVTVSVTGRSALRSVSAPYILVANHSSHLDAPLLTTTLPYRLARRLATGVAADYFYSSRIRSALTTLFFNSYPIDRSGTRTHRGRSGDLIRAGVPLLLFPEGGRSTSGALRAFQPGAAALAVRHRVPVVPVAIVGASAAMPRHTSWPRRGRPPVRVAYGAPLQARPGESVADLTERIRATVIELHDAEATALGVPTFAELAGRAGPPDNERLDTAS